MWLKKFLHFGHLKIREQWFSSEMEKHCFRLWKRKAAITKMSRNKLFATFGQLFSEDNNEVSFSEKAPLTLFVRVQKDHYHFG